jgi:phospholipase/carboxylesterase
MRAILPLDMDKTPDLTGLPVLILSGTSDSVAPPEQGRQLAKILEAAGAIVTFEMLAAGHRITAHDIPIVLEWLSRQD